MTCLLFGFPELFFLSSVRGVLCTLLVGIIVILVDLFLPGISCFGLGRMGREGGEGGIGEFTAPPLCELTQMIYMQVVITGTDLNRWEPLRCTLLSERAVIWFI